MSSAAASYATFAGMQTNEDLSSSAAAQAAKEAGEEDEIVQEIPIVISQELAHTLYLMQSPLRSVQTTAAAARHSLPRTATERALHPCAASHAC